MKNLKKVLALALAFACAFTMFASAAFTDQSSINSANTDAVDSLVALGVINGFSDGSFKPNDTVTRAEMAKMIYVLRTGKSDASAYNDDKTSFTDISSHWARGYIKYCQALGIIAGRNEFTFDPNNTVTTTEAAKMLLVTLGYDQAKAGLIGASWTAKTLALADENSLFEDVTCSLSGPCPRQYAAQMMWNTVNAYTVVMRDGEYTNMTLNGDDNLPTVGERYMGLIRTTVTIYGDKARNDSLLDGQTEVVFSDSATEPDAGADGKKTITYKIDNIMDMIGQQVELLWKESNDTKKNLDKNDKIYGMYNSRGTSVVEGIVADIKDDFTTSGKIKFNDVEYKLSTDPKPQLYTNLLDEDVELKQGNFNALKKTAPGITGDKVRLLLNDSNEVTAVYVTTSELYKVSGVSGDKVSLAGIGTIDTSENQSQVYDGIAKDDVVAVTKLYKTDKDDACFIIEKAESVTGSLSSYSGTKTITMNSTTYKVYNEGKSGLKSVTDDDVSSFVGDDLDDEFTLYLVNGYVQAVQRGEEDSKNYALITDVDAGGILDSTFNEPRVKLMFADGTEKTVVLHKDSDLWKDNGSSHNNGDEIKTKIDEIGDFIAEGEIVKYTEMSNGQYKVKEIVKPADNEGDYQASATITNFYDKDTKAVENSAGKTTVTSGDCPLWYTNTSGDYKVMNIRNAGDISITTNEYAYYEDDGKVVAAFVRLGKRPSGASSNTMYGIVTSDGEKVTYQGDECTLFHVWTGEDTLVYMDENEDGNGDQLVKGALVTFDKAADDRYTNTDSSSDIEVLNGTGNGEGKAVAVTDYSESDKIITFAKSMSYDGYVYKADSKATSALDDDVQIVYVNADDDEAGDSGMGVGEFDEVKGYANVVLVYDDGNEKNKVIGIIVNTNTDTDVMGNSGANIGKSANGMTGYYVADNEKAEYADGDTVKYTVTLAGTATVKSNLALTADTGYTVSPASYEIATGANGGTYVFTVTVNADKTVINPQFTITNA